MSSAGLAVGLIGREDGVGVGVGAGVGAGGGAGAGVLTVTPLFQTNLVPFLMQV